VKNIHPSQGKIFH